MRKYPYLILFFSLTASAQQSVLLEVNGITDKDLDQNVRMHLSQLNNADADGSLLYQRRVQDAVDKALRAKGYYNTQYQFSLTPRPRPQKDRLQLKVTLTEPVKLAQRDINILGEAADDPQFSHNVAKDLPPEGIVLNHETYDDFKANIEKLAQARGYFDGEWLVSRLEVYPSQFKANWRLHYQSGERYRYGQISFENSQIREDYLRNLLRIKTGEPYSLTDLSKLSSDFSSSSWFSSVVVEPEILEAEKLVDLNILLQPKKKNIIEVSIGFATDVGPRLQLGWKKPWINSRGQHFEANGYLSKPEQSIEFAYNLPLQSHPINYFYQVSGGLEHQKVKDTKFTGANLAVQRFWNHETGWAFSFGLKTRYDAFKQGSQPRVKTLLVYPTASLNRTRSDNRHFPLWGDSQKLTLNWGNTAWGSDVNFYRAKFSTAWIRTFADHHRITLRGSAGYLKTDQFERITPVLRYFAGGDMSLRGFSYKSISPRDRRGKLTGGSHLLTGSTEYQYQVYPNWWLATFYDTGLAAKRFSKKELHTGVGIGVRWVSPIGAIKFDLSTPIRSPENKKGVQFYIGLGSEL